MLNDLEKILELGRRHTRTEFVVSEEVFSHILTEAPLKEGDRFQLDCPYDSPNYKYLNKAYWHGLIVIHFSQKRFAEEIFKAHSRAES